MARQSVVILTFVLYSSLISLQMAASCAPISWIDATLSGISLGMTQQDVLQRWGQPSTRKSPVLLTDARKAASISRWTWLSHESFVDFDSTQRVVVIGADGPLSSDHHVIADGYYKTTTSAIKSLFGKPLRVIPESTEYTTNAWVYRGPDDLEVVFEVTDHQAGNNNRVFSIILGHSKLFPPPNPSTNTWWFGPGRRFTQRQLEVPTAAL